MWPRAHWLRQAA